MLIWRADKGRAKRAVRVLSVVSVEDMVGVEVGMTMRDAGVILQRKKLAWRQGRRRSDAHSTFLALQ